MLYECSKCCLITNDTKYYKNHSCDVLQRYAEDDVVKRFTNSLSRVNIYSYKNLLSMK